MSMRVDAVVLAWRARPRRRRRGGVAREIAVDLAVSTVLRS
jgi:hypothetical protein